MAGPTETLDPLGFESIRIEEAARRIAHAVRRTPLVPLEVQDERVELRAKLENRQETGAFKARGAFNQVASLDDNQRRRGVVACSSGNHGKALSWAAVQADVPVTIVMPENAYPNKIQACRDLGAEVVLAPSREAAEERCAALVAAGSVLVHPYDADRTIEGAGTVGLEIAEDWPAVELVIAPVGGGGLLAGLSLALRRTLGSGPGILGAEPEGAATMSLALEAGQPVTLSEISTSVQGLCPLDAGRRNLDVCARTVDGVIQLDDERILAAQSRLVQAGEVVEPAGAAAAAVVFSSLIPKRWVESRRGSHPLRVAVVLSGGNPDPQQLASLRARGYPPARG